MQGRTRTTFGRWGSLRLTASLTKLCMCKYTQPFEVPFILVRLLSIFSGNLREISWICRPTSVIAHGHTLLLSDLAKAFGQVNPHWVLRILQILNAPVWVLQYATYVFLSPTHPSTSRSRHGTCCLSSSIFCRLRRSERYPWRAQCQGLHGRQRYLWCRWAVALGSKHSHWPPRQVFRSLDITVLGTTQPLPDQTLIKQGGPSFSQALVSMPVGADVILGCATRRAHLASADVADLGTPPRRQTDCASLGA